MGRTHIAGMTEAHVEISLFVIERIPNDSLAVAGIVQIIVSRRLVFPSVYSV